MYIFSEMFPDDAMLLFLNHPYFVLIFITHAAFTSKIENEFHDLE